MVLAAALISLAVAAPQAVVPAAPQSDPQAQAEPQGAPVDGSRPYTVDGVRRAAAAEIQVQPRVDTVKVERARPGYHVDLESSFDGLPACKALVVPASCAHPWLLPSNPTWHQQFLLMAGPQGYTVPYTGMNNGETLQAAASSIAFAYTFQAIYSLISRQVAKTSADRARKKIEKVRAEIRGELEDLERANAAARRKGSPGVDASPFDGK